MNWIYLVIGIIVLAGIIVGIVLLTKGEEKKPELEGPEDKYLKVFKMFDKDLKVETAEKGGNKIIMYQQDHMSKSNIDTVYNMMGEDGHTIICFVRFGQNTHDETGYANVVQNQQTIMRHFKQDRQGLVWPELKKAKYKPTAMAMKTDVAIYGGDDQFVLFLNDAGTGAENGVCDSLLGRHNDLGNVDNAIGKKLLNENIAYTNLLIATSITATVGKKTLSVITIQLQDTTLLNPGNDFVSTPEQKKLQGQIQELFIKSSLKVIKNAGKKINHVTVLPLNTVSYLAEMDKVFAINGMQGIFKGNTNTVVQFCKEQNPISKVNHEKIVSDIKADKIKPETSDQIIFINNAKYFNFEQ